MLRAIGIDLGAGKTVMAALCRGEPETLPNRAQSPFTPSLLAIGPGGELLAGDAAAGSASAVPVLRSGLGRAGTVPFNGLRYTSTELAALFLAHLRAEAEAALGEPVGRVVLSVPAAFGSAQAAALRRAARLAGLWPLRLLHDPTAAALTYSLAHPAAQTLAVCDVGAGGAGAAIVRLFPGALTVLGTAGAAEVGGEAITRAIVAYLLRSLEEQSGLSWRGDPQAAAALRPLAGRALMSLAVADYVKLTEPLRALGLAGSGSYALTREQLDELARPCLEEALSLLRLALAQGAVAPDEVDGLLLVGGVAQMPLLQALAREHFPRAALVNDCNPLLAVAQGAAALSGLVAEVCCPICGLSNAVESSACRRCGAALAYGPRLACPRCFLPNDPRRYLCWKCGAQLARPGERRTRSWRAERSNLQEVDRLSPGVRRALRFAAHRHGRPPTAQADAARTDRAHDPCCTRSDSAGSPAALCAACGARLPLGRKVCPACHALQAPHAPGGLACRRCGQVQAAGAQTCSRCAELVAPFVGEALSVPLSLAVGGDLEVLFPRGAPLPSGRPVVRPWRAGDLAGVGAGVRLYEGEPGCERLCARLELSLPGGLNPETVIEVAFTLDVDGLLHAEAAPAEVEARLEWEAYDG